MSSSNEGVRKKFATPPVKLACTNCRAARIRCDGKDKCTPCLNKQKQCIYTTSKRGGSRVHKRRPNENIVTTTPTIVDINPLPYAVATVENGYPSEGFLQASLFQYPGAGLQHLDPIADEQMFEELLNTQFSDFSSNMPMGPLGDWSMNLGRSESDSLCALSDLSSTPLTRPHINLVRCYDSEEAILDAYYVYIHTFFPILPPPTRAPAVDRPSMTGQYYEPRSPLSAAVSAILALIPHPEDFNHASPSSTSQRRDQAQYFAQLAFQNIEMESEIAESARNPKRALQAQPEIQRIPFHPHSPVSLEGLLALLVLSTYEYAQRGNIAKMRIRSNHAIAIAMDMSLFKAESIDDIYSEAKKRAWWMTFVCACQSSIVSNTSLNFDLNDQRFSRPLPTNGSDSGAWKIFLEAQKSISMVTEWSMKLNSSLQSGANLKPVFARMEELENHLERLVSQSEIWTDQFTSPNVMSVFTTEAIVATSIRGLARIKLNSARIKLHRYSAFKNVPVFAEKHCDLEATNNNSDLESPSFSQSGSPPCCSPLGSLSISTSPKSASETTPLRSVFSSKICLQSALNIISAFERLPFPNPSGSIDMPTKALTPTSMQDSPRTMPSFACCAMQSSYALLMLLYRSRAATETMVDKDEHYRMLQANFDNQLIKGLRIVVRILENYSMASEALAGMKDQVQNALDIVTKTSDAY